MAKKKSKIQRDLFGNPLEDNDYMNGGSSIEEKIDPLEEFDHDFWEKKVNQFKTSGDKKRELEVYNIFIENSGFTSPYLLRKGTLLVDMGRFNDAFETLKSLYGCESHDTIVAPAQLQMARASAIQGKKDDMLNYLKEAFRTTIFFEGIGTYYGKRKLIRDITQITEFDKYRDTKLFQGTLTFEWEREDEIELESKINHYLKEKNIDPNQVDPVRLRLLEYLCEYTEKEVYLDFNLKLNWLVNTSNSIVIVHDKMLDYRNKFGIHYSWVHYATFNFSDEKLKCIQPLDSSHEARIINDVEYDKNDVELALKIIDDSVDVDILNTLVIRGIASSFSRSLGEETYRFRAKRRSYEYAVIVFPSSSKSEENITNFFNACGSQELLEVEKVIGKNYPTQYLKKSFKEQSDISLHQEINPLKASVKILLNNIKSEIEEIKDNHKRLDNLLGYAHTYFPHLLEEDAILFSDSVIEIVTTMFREATSSEINELITFSGNVLYSLLKSIVVGFHNSVYQSMGYIYNQVNDKITEIDNECTRLFILIYFDRYGVGDPKILHPILVTQFIKAEVPIIKSLLEYNYVRWLEKAERAEIIDYIQLNKLREHAIVELKRWVNRVPSRGTIMLYELLYAFSKYKEQTAKTVLNKELEDNVTKFNGKILRQLIKNKYFSYMEPEQVHRFSMKLDFKQIFTELNFIQGMHLVERLSKMGYKNAHDTIKVQALRLALNNNVNITTKTFKKYVSDNELARALKSRDPNI